MKIPDRKRSSVRLFLRKYKHTIFDSSLVLLVAAFLRFSFIYTTKLESDETTIFRMAYDAVHYGLLPVTSNIASIGIPHPPGVIYFFMIPALFSANPVGGAILVALFTTGAVVLTYLFVNCYFGRAMGLIAALLYATAAVPLNYARFIWQPNLMPPFVVLYFCALFRGVYDRRPGWLLFALPLLGMIYQTHPTGMLLGVPLVVALLLAPGTVRWRDWVIGLLLVTLISAPYLLHSVATRFADQRALFAMVRGSSHVDRQALESYLFYLNPFMNWSVPDHPASLQRRLEGLLIWLKIVPALLVLAGVSLAGLTVFRSSRHNEMYWHEEQTGGRLAALLQAWKMFRAHPQRCSMALLLIWQVVPLLLLSRHQHPLHTQYLAILMPGPFIFIAFFLTSLARPMSYQRTGRRIFSLLRYPQMSFRVQEKKSVLQPASQQDQRYQEKTQISGYFTLGTYIFSVLLIVAQLFNSSAMVFDNGNGYYNDLYGIYNYRRNFHPYHNSAYSIRQALAETERVAAVRKVARIYITSDPSTHDALYFLVPQMQRPATLFETPGCFVLPDPAAGPALMLTSPYSPLTSVVLRHFTTAKLVAELPRLGGEPYKLYLVSSPSPQTKAQAVFPANLSLMDTHATSLDAGNRTWLVSQWRIQRTAAPAFRTMYTYRFTSQIKAEKARSACQLNRLQTGDQLITAWPFSGLRTASRLTLKGEFLVSTPRFSQFGPLRLDRYQHQTTTYPLVATGAYAEGVTLSIRK
jgi:4-amino-4-deoxy-L-arabinose transferase-like glycosyltransferase